MFNQKLSLRQRQVLQMITEQYIDSALPVSSQSICAGFARSLSSATVRNECGQLEKLQLLEKTHTNSGRIPSVMGYRYYVDHLMNGSDSDLSLQIKTKLNDLFNQRLRSVEQILNQASLVISEMMEVATIVTTNDRGDSDQILNQIRLIPLSERKALLVFALDQDRIENKIFDVTGVNTANLQLALDIFNVRLKGTKIRDLLAKTKLIKMILAQQIYDYEQILLQFTNALINIGMVRTHQFGLKYILQNPLLQKVKINQLLAIVNSVSPLSYFAQNPHQSSDLNSVSVRLGWDLPHVQTAVNPALDRLAVISKSFWSRSKVNRTTLSLVGDRCIAYSQICNILNWLERRINVQFNSQRRLVTKYC